MTPEQAPDGVREAVEKEVKHINQKVRSKAARVNNALRNAELDREAERDTASRIQNVPIRHHHPENHRQEEQVHCDYSGPKALMVVHLEVVEQNIRHTSKARFRMQGIWKTVQAKWRQDRMWKKSKKRHCRK